MGRPLVITGEGSGDTAANTGAMASLHRRRMRVVLGIAVLLAVLAPLALWVRNSSLVRIDDVAVSGIDGRQAEQIRRALQSEAMEMTTLHVREERLLAAVSQYPVVRSLRTETDFPHGLRIFVNAYEPVAALRTPGGELTPVAGDGTLLRGNSARGLAAIGVRRLPGGDRIGRGETRGAVGLLAAAPPALRDRVARVYRGPRGLAATMNDGPKLYFGGTERLRAKWGAAAQVLGHRTAGGAAYVDLRVPERPVAGGLKPRQAESQPQLSVDGTGGSILLQRSRVRRSAIILARIDFALTSLHARAYCGFPQDRAGESNLSTLTQGSDASSWNPAAAI